MRIPGTVEDSRNSIFLGKNRREIIMGYLIATVFFSKSPLFESKSDILLEREKVAVWINLSLIKTLENGFKNEENWYKGNLKQICLF